VIGALLDLVYGERCVRCAVSRANHRWAVAGPRVGGLRPWDAPHLCADCAATLVGAPVAAHLPGVLGVSPPIFAAAREDARLVELVGELKYRGLRGLAWPLGRAMVVAAHSARSIAGPVDVLVPLPMHPRRRRTRGFNQAELLAGVVAADLGLPVLTGCLRRQRATPQQAALAVDAGERRRDNVAGAFAAQAPTAGQAVRVALVDDLVTTGATWAEAARALTLAGWDVQWGLALGVAARLASPAALDTVGTGL
jgi:predicted amidophosphoribosyltransferase